MAQWVLRSHCPVQRPTPFLLPPCRCSPLPNACKCGVPGAVVLARCPRGAPRARHLSEARGRVRNPERRCTAVGPRSVSRVWPANCSPPLLRTAGKASARGSAPVDSACAIEMRAGALVVTRKSDGALVKAEDTFKKPVLPGPRLELRQ